MSVRWKWPGLNVGGGLALLSAGGYASSVGLDGPNISLVCQEQARSAAEQPPFPEQLRDRRHGAAFEQGIRDARMSTACQQELDAHVPHAKLKFQGQSES